MEKYDSNQIRERRELQEQVLLLRDVQPEELHTTFEPSDIAELEEYQQGSTKTLEELIKRPISPAFQQKYSGEQLNLLTYNTATYDDLEDAIFQDQLIGDMLAYRRSNGDSPAAIVAFRTRRSVLAYNLTRQVVIEMPDANVPLEEDPDSELGNGA